MVGAPVEVDHHRSLVGADGQLLLEVLDAHRRRLNAHAPENVGVLERKEERERRELRAKSICRICPVGAECLDYAMTIREPYGIWGGLTEAERRQRSLRAAPERKCPARTLWAGC